MLREIRLAGGGVDVGEVVCKNGHCWTWQVEEKVERLISYHED